MLYRTLTLGLLVTLGVVLTAPAAAQQGNRPRGTFSSMINVDALIDNYARLVARKYDLTEEQDEFTQALIRDKAEAFLTQHRDELFALVDDMFAVRGGSEFSQAELAEWGQRAMPIFEDAKVMIVESNDQWRQILTPEQRIIHDADLELMYDSFAMTSDQLDRIVSGDMTVEEFRKGPQPRRRSAERRQDPPPPPPQAAAQPVERPAAVAEKNPVDTRERVRSRMQEIRERHRRNRGASESKPPAEAKRPARATKQANENFESEWEKYVREFIEKYQLDDAQKQRAELILSSCQKQAASYMAKRKSMLEQLARREKELNELDDSDEHVKKQKSEKLAEIKQQREKIFEPLTQIFERQLKPRLDKLPTPDQRQAAEDRKSTPTRRARDAKKD